MLAPSSSSIFFSASNTFVDLYGRINPVTTISIDRNFRSGSIFKEEFHYIHGFSRFLLIFGSLLMFLLGFETFINKEATRFFSNITSTGIHFFYTIFARVTVIFSLFFIMLLMIIAYFQLKGIQISSDWIENIMSFFGVSALVFFFFYLFGVIFGFCKSKFIGLVLVISFWGLFNFIIPFIGHSILFDLTENIPNSFQVDLKKTDIVTQFEKECEKKAGKFNRNNMDLEKEMIEDYWNNDYKKIEGLENDLKISISKQVDRYKDFAILVPTTFYFLIEKEASSGGFENLLGFYSYLQNMKRRFVRFYIDRCFYNDPKVLVPFIKDDENIFYAESRLPGNFRTGVAVNLIYLVLLLGFAYYRFFNFIYGVPDIRMPQLTGLSPKMRPRNMMGIITEEERVISQFYRVWSGKFGKFDHIAMVGEDNVIDPKYKGKGYPFLYVCHANQLPYDIKTIDFVRFLWGIQRASAKERAELYMALELENYENVKLGDLQRGVRAKILLGLALLKKTKCVMMNDIGFGMTLNFLEYFRDAIYDMRKKDVAMLYLSQDVHTVYKMCEYGALLQTDRAIAKQVEGETDLLKFELGEPHPDAPH
jgi:hypothetical protein